MPRRSRSEIWDWPSAWSCSLPESPAISESARFSKSSPSTSSGGNHSMKTIFSLPKAETRMAIVSLVCLALFAGCSFAPKYAEPSVQTSAAFKEMTPAQASQTDGWKTAEPSDDVLRGQWWKMFHEPELNVFESQLNVSNQSVAVALANFLAARAVVKQDRSQYLPTVTARASVASSRQASSHNQSGSSSSASTFTEYSLPFDASWEPDFWGRIRNTVKANSLEAQATDRKSVV